MKKFIILLSLLAFCSVANAQQTYSVGNETLELNTEVEGTLDLLWNTINNQFRYFVRTNNGTITELKNTKGSNKKFQEEYKTELTDLTSLDASKVNLTTYSLKNFIDNYNKSKDANYVKNDSKSKLKLRLGFFGGVSNSPFVFNPNNEITPFVGSELEVVSDNITSGHAGFISLKHNFESDEFQYSATQFALGYRYRFINKTNFNIYGQSKFATLTANNSTTIIPDPDNVGSFITSENSSIDFDAALIFGLGADVKLGNGYLTLVYDSLFAVFIDNQDNFPIDFAIGYKFNL